MDKEWLKARLLARGRGAQRELARVLGVDPSVVNKMIRTARKISADEAVAIRACIAEWEGQPLTGRASRLSPEEGLIAELLRKNQELADQVTGMSRKLDELIEALTRKLKR